MQGAIISTLHEKSGLKGWQWLFVIDFIITIPIAIYGFLMFPDTPHTVKACEQSPMR
jgi:ACS family pantothenate transporter-like MFS transporter